MTKILAEDFRPNLIALGASALLALSVFVLPYGGSAAASAFLIGIVGMAIAGKPLVRPDDWDRWALIGIGVVMVAVPSLFVFARAPISTWVNIVLGLVTLGAGLWALRCHLVDSIDDDAADDDHALEREARAQPH